MSPASWEIFVRRHFPGYLLPHSASSALSVDEAARFLQRITGRPHELALIRAVSTLSLQMAPLYEFAFRLLPDLVRVLPSQAEISQWVWEGGFQGRLDLGQTLGSWASGHPTRFVTRSRRRSFALAENLLVRAVVERLLEVLVDLRHTKAMGASGWAANAQACEGQLRHVLACTVLREVPHQRITPHEEQAASVARHPCYDAALDLWMALRAGLDSKDPAMIAKVLAEGALSPLDDSTRFEIAVVIRLLDALWKELEPRGFEFHRCLVRKDRNEVAIFARDDGARIRIFYNQAYLDAGPRDLGVRHYFANPGRLRPDITIITEWGDDSSATVVEVKLSEDMAYLMSGYHEALLYRWEYAERLRAWPKAIVVTSATLPGAPRTMDDVIAVGWDDWVPEAVVEGFVGGGSSRKP